MSSFFNGVHGSGEFRIRMAGNSDTGAVSLLVVNSYRAVALPAEAKAAGAPTVFLTAGSMHWPAIYTAAACVDFRSRAKARARKVRNDRGV